MFERIAVLIISGLLLGVPFALAMQGLLASIVYQEPANDSVSLVSLVAAIVVLVGLFACWRPARRALRLHPAGPLSPE